VQGKASGSFLQKRTKKLLLLQGVGVGHVSTHAPASINLFASFSSEKEVLLLKAAQ
jgi:hypothetical protein